jgi:hypothetical protein
MKMFPVIIQLFCYQANQHNENSVSNKSIEGKRHTINLGKDLIAGGIKSMQNDNAHYFTIIIQFSDQYLFNSFKAIEGLKTFP